MLYAADALPPCRWKLSTPVTPGLACTYEYPAKTSSFGALSCAQAETAENNSTASKDTHSFDFINPPFGFNFLRGLTRSSAAARFAGCLRQGGNASHPSILFVHKDASARACVVSFLNFSFAAM